MRHLHRCAWLALALLVAACSKDKVIDQPAKLTVVQARRCAWSTCGAPRSTTRRRCRCASGSDSRSVNNRVYAAGHKGDVEAFDLQTAAMCRGAANSRRRCPAAPPPAASWCWSAPSDGRLFALNAADGKTRWQTRLNGEVLARAGHLREGDRGAHGRWQAAWPEPRRRARAVGARAAGAAPVAARHGPPRHRRRRGAVRVRQRQGACGERQRRHVAVGGHRDPAARPHRTRAALGHRFGGVVPGRTCTRSASRAAWRCWRWKPARCGGRTRLSSYRGMTLDDDNAVCLDRRR